VLDSHLRTPPNAQVLCFANSTLILTRDAATAAADELRETGARVERIAGTASGLDLDAVLEHLAALECNEVLVEAGHTLAGEFVRRGLVDESSSHGPVVSDTRRGACSTCRNSNACATVVNSNGVASSTSATTCA
jgi:riboflavin biosynthesis pyrimidine reductase